ncbi:hypothetical protein D3C75_622880 [compost metagenome]
MRGGVDVAKACRGQLGGNVVNVAWVADLDDRCTGLVINEHAGVVFAPLSDCQHVGFDGQNRSGPHGPVPPEQVPSFVKCRCAGAVCGGCAPYLQLAGGRRAAKPALSGLVGFSGVGEVFRKRRQTEIRAVRIRREADRQLKLRSEQHGAGKVRIAQACRADSGVNADDF